MFSLTSSVKPAPVESSKDDIYTNIKTIIEPYINLARRQPIQNVGVPAHFLKGVLNPDKEASQNDKIPVLKISGFVNLANVSLQSNTDFTLPYIESIYNMAKMQHMCNGIINIKYIGFHQDTSKELKYNDNTKESFKPCFYFNRKDTGKKIYIPIDTQGDPNIYVLSSKLTQKRQPDHRTNYRDYLNTQFISKFLAQYENINCNFISIAVNLLPTKGGHANMLLVYKGIKTTYLMLYEPHGAQGVQSSEGSVEQYQIMKKAFIKFIQNVIKTRNSQVETVYPTKISPQEGIQSYMKDRNGYCYMISSFWLYIILMLTKRTTQDFNDTLFTELNIIETYVYNIAAEEIKEDQKEPKNKRHVSVEPSAAEAGSSSQRVLTVAKQGSLAKYTPDQVLYSIIVHFSYDFLTTFYMNYFKPPSQSASTPDLYSIFIQIYKDKYIAMKNKKEKKFKKLVLGYIDATGSNLSPEEIKNMERQAEEISKRVTDGLGCSEDQECLSDTCKDKVCTPYNYDKPQSQDDIPSQPYLNLHHLLFQKIDQDQDPDPDVNDPPNIDEFFEKVNDEEEEDEVEDFKNVNEEEDEVEVFENVNKEEEDVQPYNKRQKN